MSDHARSVAFWYPGIPTGSNAANRMRGRGAWHIVSRERGEVREEMVPILRGIQSAPGYVGPFPVSRMVATFHWADHRKRDIPNFGESLKAVIDSLRGVVIVDDDVRHLPELILRGVLGSGRKGIAVVVEEMEA